MTFHITTFIWWKNNSILRGWLCTCTCTSITLIFYSGSYLHVLFQASVCKVNVSPVKRFAHLCTLVSACGAIKSLTGVLHNPIATCFCLQTCWRNPDLFAFRSRLEHDSCVMSIISRINVVSPEVGSACDLFTYTLSGIF